MTSALILGILPFLPLFTGHEGLLVIRDGTKGITAALQTSAHIGCPFSIPAKLCYHTASAIYGPVKTGCYRFGRTSLFSVMKNICNGSFAQIVIPEGATASETAARIASALDIRSDDPALQAIMKNPALFEGKFFPATYPLISADASEIVHTMMLKTGSIAGKYHFTPKDFIIASIIQKEVRYPGQMRRCAGVLENRLSAHMKLECDSVLQYETGNGRLTSVIISKDSPYNLYLRNGLPPTPICNPGLDALQAAHAPEHHDYFYFVSRKDGRLYFSKNKHEHFKAVEFLVLGRPNGFKPKVQ